MKRDGEAARLTASRIRPTATTSNEAVELAGRDRIACDQVLYNLEGRAAEELVIPACERHRMATVG